MSTNQAAFPTVCVELKAGGQCATKEAGKGAGLA